MKKTLLIIYNFANFFGVLTNNHNFEFL